MAIIITEAFDFLQQKWLDFMLIARPRRCAASSTTRRWRRIGVLFLCPGNNR